MGMSAMKKKIGSLNVKFILLLIVVLLVTQVVYVDNRVKAAVSKTETSSPQVFLGIYPQGYIDQDVIDRELHALDDWAGKRVSIAAISIDIEEPNGSAVIPNQLNLLWENGYTAFINLMAGTISSKPTAQEIAAGSYDSAISEWAQAYQSWAINGKWAYIAPLPEMNVSWLSYGEDPSNYVMAYERIQSMFTQEGVSKDSVRWVFAPNGWYGNSFEEYYPGDENVDVVGFSSFNFGYCPVDSTPTWSGPEEVYGSYINSMRQLAPDKPIFITRTGVTAYASDGGTDADVKNQWLQDAYAYLGNSLGVKAILYYNINQDWDCDWAVYKKDGDKYSGYKDAIVSADFGYLSPSDLNQEDISLNINTVFLPLTVRSTQTCSTEDPVLLAVYSQNWPGLQSTMDGELHTLDEWARKRSSIIGTYLDIELPDPNTHVRGQLKLIWNNGYTPYVNLSSSHSAYDIASGGLDDDIRSWAKAYAEYATGGGGRMAFIGSLQEMNGYWVPYGLNPDNYKAAYWHIQDIFAEEGVPSESVKWVFAPNGWSRPSDPAFEKYYPGNDAVDVVAFSAYNFGYNPSNSYPSWEPPKKVFGEYLERMTAMAPTKPIFIAQTGTSAYYKDGVNPDAKNHWLRKAYEYLAGYPGVRAIIYFNVVNEQGYDWPIFIPNNPDQQYEGYRDAVGRSDYCYISPHNLKDYDLSVH